MRTVMERTVVIAMVIMIALLSSHSARAGECVVFNGSFENDGRMDSVTPLSAPERWSDVDIPQGLFGGYIYDKIWSTEDDYCLTLFSESYMTFTSIDRAVISQQVYLQDVNEIIFDVKLETGHVSDPWDPSRRTAALLMDDEVVWESNSVGSDVRGEYLDQTYIVDANYKDGWPHKLSLCLRSNVNEQPIIRYMARWDFVRFDIYCEGFGYRPGDFNRDCFVDMNDLKLLADQWLAELSANTYDLFEDADNIVNFRDFSVFADKWRTKDVNMNDLKQLAWQWLTEPAAHKYDLFEDDDDIVNFRDFAVFADNWMLDSFSYHQDDELLAADLNNDGVVDFLDYAILTTERDRETCDDIAALAGQWLQKSWLYWMD
jgi:hypothetical protein